MATMAVIVSMLFLMVCSRVESMHVFVPNELNQIGAIIFNASSEDSRIYSISSSLSHPSAKHFVDVSSLDGLVFLKRELVCSSDHISNVVPFPLTIYIESQSFRIGSSQTKVIIIPLNIYFGHNSCPHFDSFMSTTHSLHSLHSKIYSLIVLLEDKICPKISQFLAHLPDFLPNSLTNKCSVRFEPSLTGLDIVSGLQYSVEQNSSDLVSLSEFCVDTNHFTADLKLITDCMSNHLNSENVEPIIEADTK
jgi:hypothetical protein